jgi:peptidyl-prolyl cis-trans isomerase A (cyclophilin A)
MSHVFKIALVAVLFVGCTTPFKDASMPDDVKLPEVSWTKGETTTEGAPDKGEFKVQFETTAGNFTMLVHREWAPRGAERFYQLIKNTYYDGAPFYRVMPEFMVQFGMNGDPKGTRYWDKSFPDEPVIQKNLFGLVSYAKSGPNTRSTQLFINYADNARMLDPQGFSPFAEVVEGMKNVIAINAQYREEPNQGMMVRSGNKYVFKNFPDIDYIVKATIVDDGSAAVSETLTSEKK